MADDEVRIRIDGDEGPAKAETSPEIKAATERANAEAARARQEIAQAHAIIERNQQGQILTAVSQAKAEAANARAEYRSAKETGDFDRAAEAQEAIATAASRIQNLELIRNQAQRPAQPQTTGDPVEDYAASRTEPTKQWLRNHRDWVTDPQKNARLTSAHWDAVSKGLTPDTGSSEKSDSTRVRTRIPTNPTMCERTSVMTEQST